MTISGGLETRVLDKGRGRPVPVGGRDQPALSVMLLSFTPGVRGGADRSLLLLVEGLVRSGWRPLLVVPAGGQMQEEAARMGARVEVLDLVHFRGCRTRDFAKGLWQLRRVCVENHVDLIHCNAWPALQWVVPVRATLRVPVVCHFRERPSPKRGWVHLLNRSDRIIAVSSASRDDLIHAGVKGARVAVIHNAVDLSRYDGAGADPCEGHGHGHGAVVGMASRLSGWKGHGFFLKAAAQVVQAFPHAEFPIAGAPVRGEEAYAAELVALAGRLGLERRVRFVGHQEDIVPFMKSLDVLVLTSDREPFGRVVIEAMAAAKPVVAFHGGGVGEVVDHGSTGVLVPPGDIEGLARAIRMLLADRALAQAMGTRGRAKVERCFTAEVHVDRIQRLYRSVAGVEAGRSDPRDGTDL